MMTKNCQIFKIWALLTTVVLLSIGSSWAQSNNNRLDKDGKRIIGNSPIPDYNKENEDKNRDTTLKPPRVRKPLESFYFSDSLRQQRIFAWTVSLADNSIKQQLIDTLLQDFQIDYRFMRHDVGDSYLGNVGSATVPLNYFRRSTDPNFSFVKVWAPYLMTPERVLFYNSKSAYSRLSFEMSGGIENEETLFGILLTHNISPSTSFNFEYNAVGTKGQYTHQKTLARYFDISLAHTGKRYSTHMGYIFNHGEIDENGGITDDKLVTDTVISRQRDIPVRLVDATNTFRGHNFWISQSYGIPLRAQKTDELTIQKIPTIYVGMSADYKTMGRMYRDKITGQYYDNAYVSSAESKDSMYQARIDAKFFAQLQPYNRDGILGLVTGGVGNESNSYYSDTVAMALQPQYGAGGTFNRNTTYLYGTAEGAFKRYLRWGASTKINMIGDRTGDLEIRGNINATAFINKQPVTLAAAINYTTQEPDVWVQNYFSNHFAWSNSFAEESSTTINARLFAPRWGIEVGGDIQLVQNKIYFDSESLPAQYDGSVSIMGAYLRKDFRLGGFRLNHRVLMQWSTQQQVAPVPALSAFLSYSYLFPVVENVLNVEIGLNGRYHSEYYGMGYNPALAQFYNQTQVKVGDYPYVDAFVSGKWKRMRILVKLQHVNEDLVGKRNYFVAPHQPANRMMFKLGFSWSFYDD